MLSSNSLTSPACLSCTGTEPCVFVRFPGASSESDIQLRPSTGNSDICFGSMLPLTLDVVDFMCTSLVEDFRFAVPERGRCYTLPARPCVLTPSLHIFAEIFIAAR